MIKIGLSPKLVLFLLVTTGFVEIHAQNTGCTGGKFGVDGGFYSGVLEYISGVEPSGGSNDWFLGSNGLGVIDQNNPNEVKTLLQTQWNPIYERRMSSPPISIIAGQTRIDAMFARDHFGGTGGIDQTSFNTSSKNGEDPAIWDPGPQNVLGKNDIVDCGGHMFRDGIGLTSNLLFAGFVNFAEPGGAAYFDFEFFVENLTYSPGSGFNSGGPQLGHTAFEFNTDHSIKKIGDLIFAVSITSGGVIVEPRLWVSLTDWKAHPNPEKFNWSGSFDGAFTGAPYGYAGISPKPNNLAEICYYIALNESPVAPPWGTKNTKSNTWGTNYQLGSVIEIGFNLTAFGIDHSSLTGADPCYFPLNTYMIKSRSSDAFTAQLKDFAGPYSWGATNPSQVVIDHTDLSCMNSTATLIAVPDRSDVTYHWTTNDGHITVDPNQRGISVDMPGTYSVYMTLPNSCPSESLSETIGYDSNFPFFDPLTWTKTVSCGGTNGTIDITVSGGSAPYTYLWSNSATTEDLTGLSAGNYSVTVSDSKGCSTVSEVIAIEPSQPANISSSFVSPTCFGTENGSVDITVNGGQLPLSYYWSTGSTNEDLQNIPAGIYSLTVTDADGCPTTANITVTQPSAVAVTLNSTKNDSNPDPIIGDGEISINVTGGTPGYSFYWSNGATTQNPGNLDYGLYTVLVTDSKGCTGTLSVMIYEPEVCNDGIDNDGDGLMDCDDNECTPAQPGIITPSDNTPCKDSNTPPSYSSAYTYTVDANGAFDSYVWTVPATAELISGQDSRTITVVWRSNSVGIICVQGKKFNCFGPPRCLTVTVVDTPPQPGIINVTNH